MTEPPDEPGLVLATRWFTVTVSRRTLKAIAIVLAVTTLFTVLGTYLPMVYHTYAPADEMVEVHKLHGHDQSVEEHAIVVTLDRTSAGSYQATFNAELVRIGDNGSRTWVDGWRREAVIQPGRENMTTALPINQDARSYLVPGTYIVRFDIQFKTGTGVTRQVIAETPPFNLSASTDAQNDSSTEPVWLGV